MLSLEQLTLMVNEHLGLVDLTSNETLSNKWIIAESPLGGRGLFTNEDIKAGEVLYVDRPLIHGPRAGTNIQRGCNVCNKLNSDEFFKCSECALLLCSQQCQISDIHSDDCALISRWTKLVPLEEIDETVVSRALTPIRALLLSYEQKKLMESLHAHIIPQHGSEIRELKKFFDIPEEEETLMTRACCALDTNAYQIASPYANNEMSQRGLYPVSGLLNHNCTPNTRHCFNNDLQMIVKAVRPIAAGSELFTCYSGLLWGTPARRTHLYKTKHFFCNCVRCSDPTEHGTFLAALKCFASDCLGSLLPIEPLKPSSAWRCLECNLRVPFNNICAVQAALGSLMGTLDFENIDQLENFLLNRIIKLVPRTNQIVVDLQCRLVMGIGEMEGYRWNGVGVYISRVEEGSMAERAGLRPGDSILQVNGTPFSGISHEDALKMLKSCRQLTMTVRTAGALVGRASCSWMDRYGRPASPPPPRPSRSASKDRSIRRVDLCIEPGQSLGLMIRGGLEYSLGIYITGVDKDSVADRAGLMVGDQILEVNGQSFVDVTHDEAVAQLKYHKRMSLLVRDVGKVPHACTAYGERDAAPKISGWGKRRGAASLAVEQKARSLLPQSDLPALAYYMEEYVARRLTPDAFLTVLTDLLDNPQKYTLLTEIREFLLPEDRARFDELVYRRPEDNPDFHLKRVGERHMLPSSTMHELHEPEAPAEGALAADGRSPSEDSGLGLPPHDAYRSGRGWRTEAPAHPEDDPDRHEEYEEEGRRSRRLSSPCNSREGSTTALHTQHYDDSCGYLEGLRSSLGGWTQKVKSWYWGRPLELAHKLSRSFDMKEEGALLEDRGGIRRHQSMQRLGHGEAPLDENRAARVVSDHHGNLHITVKKTKPILGIAIEGGANTRHPLPRIINIHEHGAAYEAGGLEVGQLILAVDGHRVDGMPHQDVARLIAESFAQREKSEIEFLVVEAKKSNLEPKPTALIFLEA